MQPIWQYKGTAKWAIYISPLHLGKSEFSVQTTPNEEIHWRDGIRAADTLSLSFTLPRAHFMFKKHICLTGSLISIFSVMHARIWALCSYCSYAAPDTILSWITAAPHPSSCLFTPHTPMASSQHQVMAFSAQHSPVASRSIQGKANPIQGEQGPAILTPHYLADPSPASPSPHSLELPHELPMKVSRHQGTWPCCSFHLKTLCSLTSRSSSQMVNVSTSLLQAILLMAAPHAPRSPALQCPVSLITIWDNSHLSYAFILSLSLQLECELHDSRKFCLFCSLLYLQKPRAQSSQTHNTYCWMNMIFSIWNHQNLINKKLFNCFWSWGHF